MWFSSKDINLLEILVKGLLILEFEDLLIKFLSV